MTNGSRYIYIYKNILPFIRLLAGVSQITKPNITFMCFEIIHIPFCKIESNSVTKRSIYSLTKGFVVPCQTPTIIGRSLGNSIQNRELEMNNLLLAHVPEFFPKISPKINA